MERSIFSAKNVFVEALYENGILETGMYHVLHEWFNHIESNFNVKADLIIYLRCKPETSFNRLKIRGREEEKSVDFKYLHQIHITHFA